MKEIFVSTVENCIKDLCISANIFLPIGLENCIKCTLSGETSPTGREVLYDIVRNFDVAREKKIPVCQDTGMAVIFLKIGQDVHFYGGDLTESIQKGVARGYTEGCLRASIVSDPLRRANTGDNTPAVLHITMVSGEEVEISVCPKGFGSENMSAIKMFTPSATVDEICQFVVDTVSCGGSNPCPPIVVGVGIGGNFESCALLAKTALCRDVSLRNSDSFYADLEGRLLDECNALGIGPQGFGGVTTALAVNIEAAPTHIAGLPVAVNIGCHVTRHASAKL